MSQFKSDTIVDIECVGPEWDELDAHTREYLTNRAQNKARWDRLDLTEEQAEEVAAERMALDLGLARIVAIGVYMIDLDRALVLVDESGLQNWSLGATVVERHSEAGLIRRFWEVLADRRVGRIVTFNGRGYDGPNLMVRSAMYGIVCGRNLVGYRYDIKDHADLADCLSFQGATRSGYDLDYWCRRMGITTPKALGIDGSDVGPLFREGRTDLIGEYLARDLRGTGQLWQRLKPMLTVFKGGPFMVAGATDPAGQDSWENMPPKEPELALL